MIVQLQGRRTRRFLTLVPIFALTIFFWFNLRSTYRTYKHGTKIGSVWFVPSSHDWDKNPVFHPVEDMKRPPDGPPKQLPRVQFEASSRATKSDAPKRDSIALARRTAIRQAFVKSWEAYKSYAWLKDELTPLSRKSRWSLGWAAQLIDALDTLWIMDMKYEFYKAVEAIAVIDWGKHEASFLNLFEVTIRHLGGLLAAYDLSGEQVLLTKAVELGDMLYAAFDTPNRLPTHFMYYKKAKQGTQMADDSMSGAAGCSMSLEFTRLSQLTGDHKYYDAAERVKQFLYRSQNQTRIPGMWPQTMDYRSETVDSSMFTLGSGSDSLYEYLPKMHALLGGLDDEYTNMTTWALDTAKQHLLFRPLVPGDVDVYMLGNVVSYRGEENELTAEMTHLTCFTGGMYALAGKLLERQDFVEVGSRLTAGCIWMYEAFPTGIMPEVCQFRACESLEGPCRFADHTIMTLGGNPEGLVRVRDARYLLRPEAIESVFYMWRITGDEIWRDAAWRMWESIVAETETELAFAAIKDVRQNGGEKEDSMETFWLAETVKYFYLIFADEDVISLDDWVLNTEAHPMRRPSAP